MSSELWNPVSKVVAKRIEEMIAEGDGASTGRLPSQRELSTLLGVSRTSVREALTMLEASGKLRTEPGRGSFWVGSSHTGGRGPKEASESEALLDLPWKRTYPKSEITRFRYLIEAQSCRLAAMRITDEEIQRLEQNLAAFKSQTRAMDLEASAQTDFEFHQLIVEFSGVSLFIDIHLAFREVIMQAVRMYRSQRSRAWEPVVEHEKILEALKRRDPDEALYYMRSHIERSADRLGIMNAHEFL